MGGTQGERAEVLCDRERERGNREMAARAGPSRSRSRMAAVRVRLLCALVCALCGGVRAGLYTDSDQVAILTPDNVDAVLFDSPSATVLEFYASWCGHCISFSPVWKKLARDVKGGEPNRTEHRHVAFTRTRCF